ncbi:Uncharacterized conserved protein GlcG, DUF336 family [Sinosporangium album]|uniref:Uncharacterized conserved protein GlcG, DUF336 family n=1 Tax=Sinosporangium album TaxID=504805 RepID=A0A1G7ZNF0_9ACTN|nr:heme-binding protein [Sinosporangium album]SDH10096.1 Uncharacterized conserved protein GlcG, DUF336 family [Sinosporangium album]
MTRHTERAVVSGRRALAAVEAALRHAESIATKVAVVVVDRTGAPAAGCRDEDALPATSDLALAKARAAAGFGRPSESLAAAVQPGAPYFGLPAAVAAPIATFAGGLPLLVGGYCFGAVGVSGGTGEQDAEIAEAAVSAYLTAAADAPPVPHTTSPNA